MICDILKSLKRFCHTRWNAITLQCQQGKQGGNYGLRVIPVAFKKGKGWRVRNTKSVLRTVRSLPDQCFSHSVQLPTLFGFLLGRCSDLSGSTFHCIQNPPLCSLWAVLSWGSDLRDGAAPSRARRPGAKTKAPSVVSDRDRTLQVLRTDKHGGHIEMHSKGDIWWMFGMFYEVRKKVTPQPDNSSQLFCLSWNWWVPHLQSCYFYPNK